MTKTQTTGKRTREKILACSLKLFNDFGEPSVTTTMITEDLEISPGNLYYYFKNKNEIIDSVFHQFEVEIDKKLAFPHGRKASIQDIWTYLHLTFEIVWRYRFLYRDLNDLLSRNRTLELKFKAILAHKVQISRNLCLDLRTQGQFEASDEEIDALATNMVIVASYWLSYEYVRNPRQFGETKQLMTSHSRGCYQVITLISPYLRGDSQTVFKKLASDYLSTIPPA